MNQPFKRNYLQHALAVSQWMARHGAQGGIDPCTYTLDMRLNGRVVRFYPQFTAENAQGELYFTPQFAPGVSGFVGWRPHFGTAWPAGQDKLAFKQLAAAQNIRTPAWTRDPAQVRGAYIVKATRSTLGRGLRGPFDASARTVLSEGDYCEQFVVGQLLKAWYWNDQLAVAEVVDMPTVQGDGLRTLRQLISMRLAPTDKFPSDVQALAELQGLSLDAVVPAGKKALADYRYMSLLNPSITADHNVRHNIRGSHLETQLIDAGAKVWADVPVEMKPALAFSIDAVIDPKGQAWFLEANCNPLLHPAFYETMLDQTFGVRSDVG